MLSTRLNRRAWLGAGGAHCASLAGLPAMAQSLCFPSKTVRVITPLPVGSGPDVALRVVGPARSKAYPQVPSVDARPGTKGYEVAAWTGLFPPKGTTKALREKISSDVLAVLRLPVVVERYSAFGYEVFDAGPDAYTAAIRRETSSWPTSSARPT